MKWIKATLFVSLTAFDVGTFAKAKDNGRPPCATVYTVIQQDTLGNVRQGLSNPKNLKWADKDLEKKYPDVCYVNADQSVKTVFVITIAPATYHGTRVVTDTQTHETPTSGTITDTTPGSDSYGQQVGTYEGTTTTTSTSSTAVPYSFDYGIYTLTVETLDSNGKPVVRHRFQQKGIYHTYAGIPLGGRGHHPTKALIEDAVRWIHTGGLEDRLQSTRDAISAAANSSPSATEVPSQPHSPEMVKASAPSASPIPRVFNDASIGVFADGNPDSYHDGVTITALTQGGSADQAGLKAGDVILAIDDHYLFRIRELREEISHHEPGSTIRVRYRRYSTISEVSIVVGRAE